MSRRIHYIDQLRVLAVLLLFPFHAGRVFNWGEPFYAKSAIESVPIAYLLGVINAWHMPLLFFLAGASTCLAMKRRTGGQYAFERTKRLLVPLVFGIFVIVPPQTWLGARTNAGYAGSFVEYITSGAFLYTGNLFGRGDYYGGISPAHLWFIMFLWIMSFLVLPLVVWGRTDKGAAALARMARALARPQWWLAVVFAVLVAEGLPEIGDKAFFNFLVVFVLGYVTMHDDAFAASAERWRWPALLAGTAIVTVTVAFYAIKDAMPDPSLPLTAWVAVQIVGAWLVMVGLLGFGRRKLDRPSPALTYLAEASYPVYILHQTVIVVIGFYLVRAVPQPWLGWPLLIALSAAVTFALCEGVRRVGAVRFLFGMRPARGPSPDRQ